MEAARLKAAQNGESKYEGKPCKNCGSTLRFVSNAICVACQSEHQKKYRAKVKLILLQANESHREA